MSNACHRLCSPDQNVRHRIHVEMVRSVCIKISVFHRAARVSHPHIAFRLRAIGAAVGAVDAGIAPDIARLFEFRSHPISHPSQIAVQSAGPHRRHRHRFTLDVLCACCWRRRNIRTVDVLSRFSEYVYLYEGIIIIFRLCVASAWPTQMIILQNEYIRRDIPTGTRPHTVPSSHSHSLCVFAFGSYAVGKTLARARLSPSPSSPRPSLTFSSVVFHRFVAAL